MWSPEGGQVRTVRTKLWRARRDETRRDEPEENDGVANKGVVPATR